MVPTRAMLKMLAPSARMPPSAKIKAWTINTAVITTTAQVAKDAGVSLFTWGNQAQGARFKKNDPFDFIGRLRFTVRRHNRDGLAAGYGKRRDQHEDPDRIEP